MHDVGLASVLCLAIKFLFSHFISCSLNVAGEIEGRPPKEMECSVLNVVKGII